MNYSFQSDIEQVYNDDFVFPKNFISQPAFTIILAGIDRIVKGFSPSGITAHI